MQAIAAETATQPDADPNSRFRQEERRRHKKLIIEGTVWGLLKTLLVIGLLVAARNAIETTLIAGIAILYTSIQLLFGHLSLTLRDNVLQLWIQLRDLRLQLGQEPTSGEADTFHTYESAANGSAIVWMRYEVEAMVIDVVALGFVAAALLR